MADDLGEEELLSLGRIIEVPVDVLKAAVNSGFTSLVKNVRVYAESKANEIKDYQSAIEQFSNTLSKNQDDQPSESSDRVGSQQDVSKVQELEKMLAAAQEAYTALTNTVETLKTTKEGLEQDLFTAKEQLLSVQEEYHTTRSALQLQLSDAYRELDEARHTIEDLTPPPDIPGADRQELLRLLDRRQQEITRLTSEWSRMSSRLEATTMAKSEFQSKLDEVMVQDAALKLREQLSEQEKNFTASQNEWLSEELKQKTDELLQLKKEKISLLASLESTTAASNDEITHLKNGLRSAQKVSSEAEAKLESCLKRLKDTKEEHAMLEEQLRKELSSQSKLTELYQTSAEEAGKKVSELMEGVEKLQLLMEDVSRERDALSARLTEEIERHAEQEGTLAERIGDLEQELIRANDLLSSAKARPGGVSPSDVHPGMTVTQLYSLYVGVCEQLEQEREENAKLNNSITQIMQELDEKTPALQQLRLNYDVAVKSNEAMSLRLSSSLEECEGLRYEAEDAVKQSKVTERENQRLKSLTADLSRQVQVLLKECEDARGGVSSMSQYTSQDSSTDDISSSSHVISEHLVTFRNIEELQHQNQKLLAVVRELSEEKEQRESECVLEHTKGLKGQLDSALREVDELREARERQKTMVEAIVKQRDMYRVLLAQSTPLPDPPQQHVPQSPDRGSQQQLLELAETRKSLQDIQEQFSSYRKERKENDSILRKQVDEFRDQASTLRLDNTKLVSKLEYANERYQLLETQCSAQRQEVEVLRDKNQQLSSSLTKHQLSINSMTQDLLAARDKLTRAEVTLQGVTKERDMLGEEARRLRTQYENVMREQKGHTTLLTNLQAIQNNLERTEFETKSRLGVQFESVQKEVSMLKEKLNAEEERRARVCEAYEKQVKMLEQNLTVEKESHSRVREELKQSEERERLLSSDLAAQRDLVSEVQTTLKSTQEKVVLLEQDPGAEFRQKIRLLEHHVADAKSSVVSLENQLEAAKKQREHYQALSQGHEEALKELSRISEVFREEVERKLEEGAQATHLLQEELNAVCQQRDKALENKASLEQLVSSLQEQLKAFEGNAERLQSELTSTQDELRVARDDVKKFAKQSMEHWDLYRKELIQHGKSVEGSIRAQDELKQVQNDLKSEVVRNNQLQQELSSREAFWAEQEKALQDTVQQLEQRCKDLQGQNTLLHEEADKLCTRLITLQQGDERGGAHQTEGRDQSSPEQLWEVVRYVRREKSIADNKRELAEVENLRHKQLAEHLQRQLEETKEQLKEVSEAAKSQAVTNAQHAEIRAKVETLNLLTDSNRLLREEKDRMYQQIRELEGKCQELGEQLKPLREANRSLVGQKDTLLAEKAALKNEVARWSERTTQLIEQYNKVDPEEYKRLLEERDVTTVKMATLQESCEQLKVQLSTTQQEKAQLESSGQQKSSQLGEENRNLTTEMATLRADNAAKQKDLTEKTSMITKLRDVGRKYRSMYEETNKKLEEAKKETDTLKSVAERQTKELEEARQASAAAAENTSKAQELADALKTIEALQKSSQEQEEKVKKLQAVAAKMKQGMDKMKHERDQVSEEARNEKTHLTGELERLQQRLDSLQSKYDAELKQYEEQLSKQQQQQRPPLKRKVAMPPAIPGGPVSAPLQTAPTAAVKPTVTTTPTASIRPLPALVTMAPTAHVTPTMLTVSTDHGNSHTATATMFVRQVSPQVAATMAVMSHPTTTTTVTQSTITATITATPIPTSSTTPLPANKRKREEELHVSEQESIAAEVSDSKKPRHVTEEATPLDGGSLEMDTRQRVGLSKQLESARDEQEQLDSELVPSSGGANGSEEGLGTGGVNGADECLRPDSGEQMEAVPSEGSKVGPKFPMAVENESGDKTGDRMEGMSSDKAGDQIEGMSGDKAGEQMEGMSGDKAGDQMEGMSSDKAGEQMEGMSGDKAGDQMEGMSGDKAGEQLEGMAGILEVNASGQLDESASDEVKTVQQEVEPEGEKVDVEVEEDKMAAYTVGELEEGEIAGQSEEDVIGDQVEEIKVVVIAEEKRPSAQLLEERPSAQLLEERASAQLLEEESAVAPIDTVVETEQQLSEETADKVEVVEPLQLSQDEEEGEELRRQEVGTESKVQEGNEEEVEEEEEEEGDEGAQDQEVEESEEEQEEEKQEQEEEEQEEGDERDGEDSEDEQEEGEYLEEEEEEGSQMDPIVIESESEAEGGNDNYEVTDDTQDVPQPREDSRTAATLPAHGPQVPSSADEELPDDETSVDITAPPVVPGNMAASRPTHFMRGRLQPSLFSGERNVGTFGLEMGGEDHTVPHTPVLEGKVLENKVQIIPSLSEPSTRTVSHLATNVTTITSAIQSIGETQIDLQLEEADGLPVLQQEEESTFPRTTSQEPFGDMGTAEEFMEVISDDEGSVTRGGSGLEDEEGRQDVTGAQSVPGTSDSTMGREVSPGGSESSLQQQQRKRKLQPIVWDGPPAAPVPAPPRPPNPPRAVARRSRGRGAAAGESRRAIQFKRGSRK